MAKIEEGYACADQQNFSLLRKLEKILASDPFIDEVGHIHPTQLAALNREVDIDDALDPVGLKFWHGDRKLAISTEILFQLYKQAKGAFFDAIAQYKMMQCNLISKNGDENSVHRCSELGNDVLKHSRALLLLSSDFGTAWNSRKLIVREKDVLTCYMDEFQLSKLILSYSPKSDQAWSHRRWVIKAIAGKVTDLPQIVGRESELVEKIAERSKMNYRAWNHRCWLVQFMAEEQVLDELKKSRNWAGTHVADSSCFHYRKRLMTRILEDFTIKTARQGCDSENEIYSIWKEELAWDEVLIKRYIGREALWLYRRFLSVCWLSHFITSDDIFMENEICLVHSCLNIPDNDFDDYESQAIHSTAYILWLANQMPRSQGTELRKRLRLEDMKGLLEKYCPERTFFVSEELLSPPATQLYDLTSSETRSQQW